MKNNENKEVKKEVKTTYNVKQKNIDAFTEYLKKQNKK